MSHKETTDLIGHLDAGRSPDASTPNLVEQARQAYEQKRTKDCLDLTRAILLIDPENTAAHLMRSSIQSEMRHDLENARAFLREAQAKESAVSLSEPAAKPVSEPPLPKNIAPQPVASNRRPKFRARNTFVCVGVLVALGCAVAGFSRYRSKPSPVSVLRIPGGASSSLGLNETQLEKLAPSLVTPGEETAMPFTLPLYSVAVMLAPRIVDPPASVAEPPSPSAPAPPASLPPSKVPEPAVAAPADGTLAVSSPTVVDIYKDATYIGSAPVSLELPAGSQTLEYRHGNFSRKMTHLINSNETTRVMITFEVDVQINSKPWAEVFLDGVERKALGQTPLSGVRVPIGSVLVFENPGFARKKYRVTGNETGIQNVFP